ncbi:MAG: translation initiation factor IF-2 [Patescibacteria group bacterium]|nr:translation initiation factor IF-2 [Patescibacteria group bacterium]
MNITELARRLKTTAQELKEKLSELGFDIGPKAIQIPDEQAKKVIAVWQKMKKEEEKKRYLEKLKEKMTKGEVLAEKKILIPQTITVRQLAEKLNLPVNKVIQQLIKNGILATINDNLDFEIVAIVAEQLGFKVEKETEEVKEKEKEIQIKEKLKILLQETDKKNLKPKAPVVVVMGHVDHGKTSLLDAIRQTQIAASEAGAITQHIGAYQVEKKGKKITFIDTPGHEAFKVMRARGGQVADLAILVIAADDGLQPQTIESLEIIQKENLPFIVAINKIDKPEADPEKIKKQLSELNLTPEEWGGKTICQNVSAATGQGVDELLDLILLVAEMEKERLLANPYRPAIGTIIEAHLDKGVGPVATVIIHTGRLKIGDSFIAGESYGKVRLLKNWQGQNLNEALPGTPVQIIGLKTLPVVGDILEVKDKKEIKELKKKIKIKKVYFREISPIIKQKEEEKEEKVQSLNLIIKADKIGSLEAIIEALKKLETPEISIKIIKKGLGSINENDVLLAQKNQALVFGFQVESSTNAQKMASEEGIKINLYQVIYDLIEAVKKELTKISEPKIKEVLIGKVKILALFRKEKNFSIVGGRVLTGIVKPETKIRLWRNDELFGEGRLSELQINRMAVKEAHEGEECGIKYQGSEEIEVGDIFEVYQEEVK